MDFENLFSLQTGRKQMAILYRRTPLGQVLQGAQNDLRDTLEPQESDAGRRLDGLLRPHGRLLHTRQKLGGHIITSLR
jgi:hypothetical protein